MSDGLQQLIDGVGDGDALALPAHREIQGPLTIRKPIIVDGRGATCWSLVGPVLRIETDGVELRNLNVEVTEGDDNLSEDATCALVIRPGSRVVFHDVTVRGNVRGMPEEAGDWHYPLSIRLGTLKPDERHKFTIKLSVPVPCQFLSEISGLSLDPRQSRGGGVIETRLMLDPLAPGVLLRGSILLRSAFLARRIMVTGNVAARGESETAAVGIGELIYEPPRLPEQTVSAKSSTASTPLRSPAGEDTAGSPYETSSVHESPKRPPASQIPRHPPPPEKSKSRSQNIAEHVFSGVPASAVPTDTSADSATQPPAKRVRPGEQLSGVWQTPGPPPDSPQGMAEVDDLAQQRDLGKSIFSQTVEQQKVTKAGPASSGSQRKDVVRNREKPVRTKTKTIRPHDIGVFGQGGKHESRDS